MPREQARGWARPDRVGATGPAFLATRSYHRKDRGERCGCVHYRDRSACKNEDPSSPHDARLFRKAVCKSICRQRKRHVGYTNDAKGAAGFFSNVRQNLEVTHRNFSHSDSFSDRPTARARAAERQKVRLQKKKKCARMQNLASDGFKLCKGCAWKLYESRSRSLLHGWRHARKRERVQQPLLPPPLCRLYLSARSRCAWVPRMVVPGQARPSRAMMPNRRISR